MKAYLLATAATLILSGPALAAGQGQTTGAAGSAQQTQYQNQQPGMGQAAQSVSPSQLSEQEIRDLQQALNREGFDAGNVDGVWGPETRAAVSNFQQHQNIAGAGELNQETLSALGVQVAQQDQIDQGPGELGTTGSGTTGSGSFQANEPAPDMNTAPAPNEQPDSQQ